MPRNNAYRATQVLKLKIIEAIAITGVNTAVAFPHIWEYLTLKKIHLLLKRQ
jgi:hypothetical protein